MSTPEDPRHPEDDATEPRRDDEVRLDADASETPEVETTDADADVDPEVETTDADADVDPEVETTDADADVDPVEETTDADVDVDPAEETTDADADVDPVEETTDADADVVAVEETDDDSIEVVFPGDTEDDEVVVPEEDPADADADVDPVEETTDADADVVAVEETDDDSIEVVVPEEDPADDGDRGRTVTVSLAPRPDAARTPPPPPPPGPSVLEEEGVDTELDELLRAARESGEDDDDAPVRVAARPIVTSVTRAPDPSDTTRTAAPPPPSGSEEAPRRHATETTRGPEAATTGAEAPGRRAAETPEDPEETSRTGAEARGSSHRGMPLRNIVTGIRSYAGVWLVRLAVLAGIILLVAGAFLLYQWITAPSAPTSTTPPAPPATRYTIGEMGEMHDFIAKVEDRVLERNPGADFDTSLERAKKVMELVPSSGGHTGSSTTGAAPRSTSTPRAAYPRPHIIADPAAYGTALAQWWKAVDQKLADAETRLRTVDRVNDPAGYRAAVSDLEAARDEEVVAKLNYMWRMDWIKSDVYGPIHDRAEFDGECFADTDAVPHDKFRAGREPNPWSTPAFQAALSAGYNGTSIADISDYMFDLQKRSNPRVKRLLPSTRHFR